MGRKFAEPPGPDTDAFRLFAGENVAIDSFAGHWLVQTRDAEFPAWVNDCADPRSVWWKRLERENRESPSFVRGENPDGPIVAQEHGAAFEIDFTAGYSHGIFLDQRLNRQAVRAHVENGHRILNTFAYTCAFSVVAAQAGATATSLDLSHNSLEWGKRNFRHNGLKSADHFFTRGDTFDWLRRWAKSGIRFHGIILDPPTFSRNQKGKVFRVEKNYGELIELAARILEPGGWMLACTNFRGLDAPAFERLISAALPKRPANLESRPMPPEFGREGYLKSVWVETG